MFLDHSELWIWRAVQGWERKTGDRTLAWQTEGPRSILQKEKKTALMSSINVCGGSGSLKRALSVEGTWWCKGNHEKARQGHLLHTHCGSPAPGSLTGDHRNYLRCLFRGKNKGKRYHKYYCDLSLLKRGQEKVLMLTRWPRSFVTSVTELYRGQRNWFWEVTKTSRRHIPSHMRKSNEILLYFWES